MGCSLGLGGSSPRGYKPVAPTTLFSWVLLPLGGEPSGLHTGFTEAITQTPPPLVANVDMDRCTTPLFEMEGENWYLLVITTSIEQLSLGPSGNNPEKSSTNSSTRNMFQNPWMAAVLLGSTRVVGYGGTTVKELKEWGENGPGVVSNQKATFGQ